MKRLILFLGRIHPDRNVWSTVEEPIDVQKLDVVESFDYDEIVLTGGNLFRLSYQLRYLVNGLKEMFRCMGKSVSIFIHTNSNDWQDICEPTMEFNGLVYSPRDINEVRIFREVNNKLMKDYNCRDNWINYLIVNDALVDALPENTRCWTKGTAREFLSSAEQTDIRRANLFWI